VPLFNHMTGATICDFCSSANPLWRYPAATFHDSFGSKSVEDWLACEACHAMIEAGDREGLIERAFRCPGIPLVVAMRGREWARNYVVDLHNRFRTNRRGQPYRMAS